MSNETQDLKLIQNLTAKRVNVLEEEVNNLRKESATFQARKDALEEWLIEYRDELRENLNDTHDEFVKSRRRQLIGEINELLNWEL